VATLKRSAGLLEHDSPKGGSDEAYLPAKSGSASARAWLSTADEEPSGPRHPEAASRQGTPAACYDGAVEVAVGIQTGPFKRADRLVRPEEFAYVLRYGRRVRMDTFVVAVADRAREGGSEGVRLGVTVSRRVGKAVVRNRVKRRIREWFRYERPRMQGNLDMVVVARRAAAGLSGRETAGVLKEGVRAAGAAA
jgi:ribonuclease P protein component